MTFTITYDIDHAKLNTMLDAFLKSHNHELTELVGKCLTMRIIDGSTIDSQLQGKTITSITQSHGLNAAVNPTDHQVDNRPLIGDSIPDDPFSTMFSNPNSGTTRYKDRNVGK